MIYILYLLLSLILILTSVNLADYVGLLEKKTNVSGALLSGVLLASVTSLPELFASLSATIVFDNPIMAIGNILGSNIFNLALMSLFFIFFIGTFSKSKLSKANTVYFVFVLAIYLVLFLGIFVNIDVNISVVSISFITVLIALIYFTGLYKISKMPKEITEEEPTPDTSPLTVKQVSRRFALACIVLVAASIGLAFASVEIEKLLNLGSGLAGAILIGVTTSAPEIAATLTLIRGKYYDMAVSNIIGANFFNLIIICVCDIFSFNTSMYAGLQSDMQIKYLVYFGLASTIAGLIMVLAKPKTTKKIVFLSLFAVMIVAYVAFLVLSVI